jgi:hypothetical protein
MTVLREQSSRQNSAYRSGCHNLFYYQQLIDKFNVTGLALAVP